MQTALARKPIVFATVPWYLPGFRGGGKPVAVRNLTKALAGDFTFKLMTANHDLGDRVPYRDVPSNRWTRCEALEAVYIDPHRDALRAVRTMLSDAEYDVLYLNSIFSRAFAIVPLMLRKFGAVPERTTIIAPRGELGASALGVKARRKRSFLAMARALGLFRGIVWHASGAGEADDIRALIGTGVRIRTAADIPNPEWRKWQPPGYAKSRGRLEVLFFSRITPVKNLHLAIEALRGVKGEVVFRIAGPIDDSQYWSRCRRQIVTLGSNILTEYSGPIVSSEVRSMLQRHGLLLLPTAGESFGFAILEALAAGCPVLIGDRTRWTNLADHGVGWDLPVARIDLMRAAIQACVDMGPEAHRAMSLRARAYAQRYLACDDSISRHVTMFHAASGDSGADRMSA